MAQASSRPGNLYTDQQCIYCNRVQYYCNLYSSFSCRLAQDGGHLDTGHTSLSSHKQGNLVKLLSSLYTSMRDY